MIVVLISARYCRILEWIQGHQCSQVQSISCIKKRGPKVFLYVDTQLSYSELISLFKEIINAKGGSAYVYQFYTIYHGMIDYHDYLSEKTKQTMPYYQSVNKDLSDEEMGQYVKSDDRKEE